MLVKNVLAAAFGAILILPAMAADENKEVSIAAFHAGLAGNAMDIKTLHMHLQHVLNCLVGPKGAGYDPSQMNPCISSGNGALPDAADAKMQDQLAAAVSMAKAGLVAADLALAKKDAADLEEALQNATAK